MRQAEVYWKRILAGILTEYGGEYHFCYDESYLNPTLIYELIEPTLIVDALYCHSMIIFVFFDRIFYEFSCHIQEKQLSLFRYLDGVGVMLSFLIFDAPCPSNTSI